MKQKIIILQGLQGSGKSTYANAFIKKDKSFKRINRDAIRHMIDNYTHKSEKLVHKIWQETVKSILQNNNNLIIDEMSLNKDRLKNTIEWLKTISPNAYIEVKEFKISLDEAIERDKRREFSVGEKVIRQTYNKYIADEPEKDCYNFDYLKNSKKPTAYIFDIDGTMAIKHPDRSIFDGSKVDMDFPIIPVINVLKALKQHHKIIILSGRDGAYKEVTENWLYKMEISYNEFYIRAPEDNRRDSIIKEELYKLYIEPVYDVLGVFDDRIQVLGECWQDKLGLFTFDVRQDAYGIKDF